MDAIDRLGWADGFSFLSYGRRIGVRVSDPNMLDRLKERLPDGWRPSKRDRVERLYSVITGGQAHAGTRHFHLLYGDWERIERSRDLAPVLNAFETSVRMFVAEFARRRVFFHAGVVGWRGHAVLLPGPTLAGKTTLVASLVRMGARYYSDEFAVLDGRGHVHPFHKPLALRGEDYRQENRSIEDLGGKRGTRPLAPGLVVVTEFREGMHWQPRRLSPGHGALELIANAPAARRDRLAVMDAASWVSAAAPVLRGRAVRQRKRRRPSCGGLIVRSTRQGGRGSGARLPTPARHAGRL